MSKLITLSQVNVDRKAKCTTTADWFIASDTAKQIVIKKQK